MRTAGILLLLCLVVSCTTTARVVQSSGFTTARALSPSTAPVEISATRDPPDATELGVAEAHGGMPAATLEAVISEFRSRVAAMGGNYGRIDTLATNDEVVLEQYTYECGYTVTTTTESVPVTQYVSQTCFGVQEVEVVTLSVVGRAFRREGR